MPHSGCDGDDRQPVASAEVAERAHDLVDLGRTGEESALFDEAEVLLREALEVDPDFPGLWVERGTLETERHIAAGRHGPAGRRHIEAARAHFQEALRLEPGHEAARIGIAHLHELDRQPARALATYDELLVAKPGDPRLHMLRGGALMLLDRDAEAVGDLEQAAVGFEKQGEQVDRLLVLNMIGRIQMKEGDYDAAEALLLESVELLEEQSEQDTQGLVSCPYLALGRLYSRTDRQELGAEMFVKAAEMQAHLPQTQYEAAAILFAMGDLERAGMYAERALALRDEPAYHELLGKIAAGQDGSTGDALFDAALGAFQRHAFAEADALVQRAVAQQPSGRALVLESWLLLLDKRFEDALERLDRIEDPSALADAIEVTRAHLDLTSQDYPSAQRRLDGIRGRLDGRVEDGEPSDAWERAVDQMAYLAFAWLESNQARHELALPWFDKVLALEPAHRFALLGKGNALNALGELDQAAVYFRRVLEQEPDSPYALAGLGLIELNQGHEDEAERFFQQAEQVGPESYACPHEGLGLVYLRQGKVDQARSSFEDAISASPEIGFEKYNGLARIYMTDGRLDEAEELLQRSLRNNPGDNEAGALLTELAQLRAGVVPRE